MAFFDNITQIRLNGEDIDEVYLNSNKVYPSEPKLYLEYIESTGSQWINTLVYPTLNTGVEIDFQYTTNTVVNRTRVFGERQRWNNGFYLGTDNNALDTEWWYLFKDRYGARGQLQRYADLNRHTVKLDNVGFYLDGSLLKTTNATTAFVDYAPICLFGAFDENDITPTTGIYKMYGCKLYENGVLIKDYVPVLDPNDVACLYDRVNKEFIYNSGTGDFSYSLTNSYKPVQYLKNTGRTQYIDTNYVYTSNSARIDTKFQQTETRSEAVFGYYYNSGYYKTVLTAHNGNYYISNYNPTGTTYSIGVDHEISAIINGNSNRTGTYTITENGNIISSGNQVGIFPDSSIRNTMLLFAQQASNGIYTGPVSKIYYFKMWDNSVLVRDLIPVLKENTTPCMYDRVTKQFYLNAGSGTFDYE